jgi:predicted RNA-binding Zn-ribbon protein involved in translation (DUF1610 family)
MIDADKLRERLRERVTESRSDYDHGYCLNCEAQLMSADVENDHTCTNCGSGMDADDEDCCHFDD